MAPDDMYRYFEYANAANGPNIMTRITNIIERYELVVSAFFYSGWCSTFTCLLFDFSFDFVRCYVGGGPVDADTGVASGETKGTATESIVANDVANADDEASQAAGESRVLPARLVESRMTSKGFMQVE